MDSLERPASPNVGIQEVVARDLVPLNAVGLGVTPDDVEVPMCSPGSTSAAGNTVVRHERADSNCRLRRPGCPGDTSHVAAAS